MNKTAKIALIIGTVAVLGVTGVVALYVIKKRRQASEEQFNEFKTKSLAAGWDVFLGTNPAQNKTALMKWKKNLTKSEAQTLIENTFKAADAEAKKAQDAIIAPILAKWQGKEMKS
jgi:hypothetical protein